MKVSSNRIAVKFFSQKATWMMNHEEQPQRVMPKSSAFWNSEEVVNWQTHIISCLPGNKDN